MSMTLGAERRWRSFALAPWAFASIWFAAFEPAHADEASGTWTGELEGHGSYYYERSTEVWVPTGRLSMEAPNGMRVNASYLADVIASASIAQGIDSDQVHIEVRQGVGTGFGKTIHLGENELDLSVNGIYSWESDYFSWFGGVRAGYLFNQKNTGVSLGVTGVHDSIYMNSQQGRTFVDNLDGVTLTFGFSQVVSPVLTFGAGYQFVYLTGFLGNPYRVPQRGPSPFMESPPETRIRHNLEFTASLYSPATRTTFQGFARLYTDSWDLNAITPEVRIYQQLGRDFGLRLRARYYLQGRTFFALEGAELGMYAPGYTGPITADPKLSGFYSIQLGGRISFALTAFERSFLRFFSRGVLDLSFDHQWTTVDSTSFGRRNFFMILGGRLPF
jgi:hypothetical protein